MAARLISVVLAVMGLCQLAATASTCDPSTLNQELMQRCGEVLGTIQAEKPTFQPRMSTVVSLVLRKFNVNTANLQIPGTSGIPGVTQQNLLQGIDGIPYFAFVVMDLISGFQLTEADLTKLGIPPSLSSRENQIKLIHRHFQFTCAHRNSFNPSAKCLKAVITDKCGSAIGDEISSLLEYGQKSLGFYCDSYEVKNSVFNKLDNDLGKVFAPLAKKIGVFKDPSSPAVFNMKRNSPILQPNFLQNLQSAILSDCQQVVSSISSGGTDISTILKNAERAIQPLVKCASSALSDSLPGVFDGDSLYMNHIKWFGEAYGVSVDKEKPTSDGVITTATYFTSLLTAAMIIIW